MPLAEVTAYVSRRVAGGSRPGLVLGLLLLLLAVVAAAAWLWGRRRG